MKLNRVVLTLDPNLAENLFANVLSNRTARIRLKTQRMIGERRNHG